MHPDSALSSSQLTRFSRIGMFDSGLGGLSVLRKLAELPGADSRSFIYLGDSARCPYGNRSAEEIQEFVAEIVHWLLSKNVDAIVMACNTSAAMARATADEVSTVPVFDLIQPTADYLSTLPGRIGIMATMSTVRSQAFSRAVKAANPQADIFEIGCPELVPIVESGSLGSAQSRAVLAQYVDQFIAESVKTVVLGCTHFPFLRAELESIANGRITFVDPAQILSGTNSNDGQAVQDAVARCELFVTGDTAAFASAAAVCLGNIPLTPQQLAVSTLTAYRTQPTFAMVQESVASPAIPTVVQ